MTLGTRIAAFAVLATAQACSIQSDVPEFVYPETTVTDAPADAPALQPTGALIEEAPEPDDTYEQTIRLLDGRAYRLRRSLENLSDP